jgi:hypothetical protein
MTVSYID